MRRVVLDTDAASLIIKQRLLATLLRELVGAQTGITFVTLGELTRWATMRQWDGPRHADLTRWLAHRRDRPNLGEISAYAARRGSPRPQNDTWIGARCLVYDLPAPTPSSPAAVNRRLRAKPGRAIEHRSARPRR
jgi:toxin FitB